MIVGRRKECLYIDAGYLVSCKGVLIMGIIVVKEC